MIDSLRGAFPHETCNEAATFAPLAEAPAARWRVIALDQRGHGPTLLVRGERSDILDAAHARAMPARHPGRVRRDGTRVSQVREPRRLLTTSWADPAPLGSPARQ